jgi:hypothetical protein
MQAKTKASDCNATFLYERAMEQHFDLARGVYKRIVFFD